MDKDYVFFCTVSFVPAFITPAPILLQANQERR